MFFIQVGQQEGFWAIRLFQISMRWLEVEAPRVTSYSKIRRPFPELAGITVVLLSKNNGQNFQTAYLALFQLLLPYDKFILCLGFSMVCVCIQSCLY